MPLANGRHMLAIPGPSIMPDRVLQAMHRPAPNIYTGEIVELETSKSRMIAADAEDAASVKARENASDGELVLDDDDSVDVELDDDLLDDDDDTSDDVSLDDITDMSSEDEN